MRQWRRVGLLQPDGKLTGTILSSESSNVGRKMEYFKEIWAFLRYRKKLWLAPIILVLVMFGGLLILAQGSVVAPFIYTLF